MDVLQKREQLNKIFEKGGVILAYLFGSAARKETGPLSDIDIAIVFPREIGEDEQLKRQFDMAYEIEKLFDVKKADIINLDKIDSPLFRFNAVLRGIPVFVKDNKAKFYIESKIMREYEDTKHLRNVRRYYLYKGAKEGTFGKLRKSLKSGYLQEKYAIG